MDDDILYMGRIGGLPRDGYNSHSASEWLERCLTPLHTGLWQDMSAASPSQNGATIVEPPDHVKKNLTICHVFFMFIIINYLLLSIMINHYINLPLEPASICSAGQRERFRA